MSWKRTIQEQFAGRHELSLEQLAEEFGLQSDARELLQKCLGTFFQEYGVPIGLLRADDSLQPFITPPPTRNPLASFFRQAAYQDSASELNYALKKRRRAIGQALDKSPMTVGEYVRAWVG